MLERNKVKVRVRSLELFTFPIIWSHKLTYLAVDKLITITFRLLSFFQKVLIISLVSLNFFNGRYRRHKSLFAVRTIHKGKIARSSFEEKTVTYFLETARKKEEVRSDNDTTSEQVVCYCYLNPNCFSKEQTGVPFQLF